MKIIISVSLLMILLCSGALAATIKSDFNSVGDGTMMHYSYLKEPGLQESGYTRGYKAGSFSYFNEGSINYSDSMVYDDGMPPTDGNSSVNYQQVLHFDGYKGISEFYGKGFYPSNRAVSAWKKIRYDDVSYNKSFGVIHLSGSSRIAGAQESSRVSGSYDLGDSYSSSKIDVEASVKMGPVKNRPKDGYEFNYTATIEDGILEIRDASGWTNKTGALRVDWERDAIMRGNFTTHNKLVGENLFFPGAGADESWLPCCFSGTIPTLECKECSELRVGKCMVNDTDKWPNDDIYATLAPTQLTPTLKRDQNCSLEYDENNSTYIFKCTNISLGEINCTSAKCSGFECIHELYGMRAPGWSGEAAEEEVGPQILVKKVILSINGSTVKYKIEVTNSGTTALRNVNVTDVLPDGMDYNEGNSRMISTEEINAKFPPVTSDRQKIPTQEDYEAAAKAKEPAKMSRGSSDTTKTPDWNLTWKIDILETSDTQNIYLNVTNPKEDVKKVEANRVYAEGTWLYGNITVSNVAKANYGQGG